MGKTINLIALFTLLILSVSGQNNAFKKEKCFYLVKDDLDTTYLASYYFTNLKVNNLLIWFDRSNSNQKDRVRSYFYDVKGDYSLIGLLNEETVLNKRFDIIGENFIKEIKPKETFIITVLYKSKKEWLNDKFDEIIKSAWESSIPSSLVDALQRNRSLFYNSGVICFFYDQLK